MSITHPAPTPREVFGADAQRYLRLYDTAVTSVLEQCKARLRRGVAPASVTALLRQDYLHRLAPLAAGVEVFQDALLERDPDGDAERRAETHVQAMAILDDEVPADRPVSTARRLGLTGPAHDGVVRYAPFGNAAPRPTSRKKAQA